MTAEQEKVRELQRTLYRAAKADPGRRFHALYDKVYRRDVLERAWGQVRANRGAAGIDRVTLAAVEQYGVDRLLGGLAADLKAGSYRPLPARRVFIPKPGSVERRPLSIPTVRDRIVQAALKTVIEPIFEADFEPCSFGFRPKRTAHDALQLILDECFKGRRWVVETDIADCFEAIPHERLMRAIEERIVDRHVLKLLRVLLRAGVMEDGTVRRSVSRTPQGGVVSPVLCNVYLHRLDRDWQTRGHGVLVRYADDLVVMCRTETEARRVALTQGNAARTRPHPRNDGAGAAAAFGRRRRAGREQLPARLGRVLQIRQLGPSLRQDRPLRGHAALALRSETAPSTHPLRLEARRLRVAQPHGPDQPQRTRHRTTTQQAVAGKAECRR